MAQEDMTRSFRCRGGSGGAAGHVWSVQFNRALSRESPRWVRPYQSLRTHRRDSHM